MFTKTKSIFTILAFITMNSSFAQSVREIGFNLSGATPLSSIVNQTPGPVGQKNIEIRPGEIVYIDRDVDVGELVINGQLHCGEVSAEVKATSIYVNGHFQCGTAQKPYDKKLLLSLKHSALNPSTSVGYRGMVVNKNGNLILNGKTERAGYYKLNKTAFAGEASIELDQSVQGRWAIGDEIVLAPSSYNPNEGETLIVSQINSNGKIVSFTKALKYKHWGEIEKIQSSRGEVLMDQRAEVANLTRSIVIRADESITKISEADIKDGQLGGHVMVNRGGFASVDGVEFYKLGQAGIMARYPFHWHFVGDAPGQYIKNSSIHKSFQRCVTVHQTNQALVSNNVCFSFKGHGFFLEDGNEINNTISGNLGIGAQFPSLSKILLQSDNMNLNVDRRRFPPVSVFWISNPQNTVTRNIASGSVGTGFWMSFVDEVRKFNSQSGEFDGEVLARPLSTATKEFSYNTAHSTLVGHTWDGAPAQKVREAGQNPGNGNNPQDRNLQSAHYAPPVTPVFPGLVAYKNLYAGIYFRGDSVVFDNAIFADNGWSAFLAYNQMVRNSVFIGKSKNHSNVEDDYLYNQRRYTEKQAGIVLYDGPWELVNVDFLNFSTSKDVKNIGGTQVDVTSTPMFTIGGTEKLTNLIKNVKFSPEPYHRLYQDFLNEGWADKYYSNNIRDLDGSLTGIPGAVVVADNPITHDSACGRPSMAGKESYYNFVVCPPETKISTIWFNSSERGASNPYLVRRNDGAISFAKKDWGIMGKIGKYQLMHLKATVLDRPQYNYDVLFAQGAIEGGKGVGIIGAKTVSEKPNTSTPVLKILGYGSDCSMGGQPRFNSLAELTNSTKTGYYSNNKNDFYIKLVTHQKFGPVKANPGGLSTESETVGYGLYCKSPVINEVIGYLSPVIKDASGSYISGWACDYGKSNEIDLHIYVKGSTKQEMIMAVKANLPSEEAVNFACADSSMSAHRFHARIPDSVLSAYPGAAVYAYGISTSGKENAPIANSGFVTLSGGVTTPPPTTPTPTPPVTPTPTPPPTPPSAENKIIGFIDEVKTVGSRVYVNGWVCDFGKSLSVDAHVYIGDGKAQEMIGAFKANGSPGDGPVAQACGDKITGVGHRFSYEIASSVVQTKPGKNIFVFGISTSGKENAQITHSGSHKIPAVTATPTPPPPTTPVPTPTPTPPSSSENKIIGHIDEVKTVGSRVYVNGWVCDFGKSLSVDAHVYIGDGKAQEMIGAFRANGSPGDGPVAQACGDKITGVGHRFSYEVAASVVQTKPGKNIFVFGISTSGKENAPISNSGVFKIPGNAAAPTPPAPTPSPTTPTPPAADNKVIGYIEGIQKDGSRAYVNGWVCDFGRTFSIDAHVYIGDGKAQEMIGAFKANGSPNDGPVAQACGDKNAGVGHRFSYELPASVMQNKKGKNVYVFGISISGKENAPITYSGTFKIP